jgi:hypothetical protein
VPPHTVSSGYLRVAERSLDAGAHSVDGGFQEKAAFLAYHAFESVGGAFCEARGVRYHPASHPGKLTRFIQSARQERFARAAATLASQVGSLRNRVLYPRAIGNGRVELPESVITAVQARRLLGRIRSLRKEVSEAI